MAAIFPVKFDGKNYDLKKFMRDHPGGVGTLKHFKGKCVLEAMDKFGHSNGAYHMLKDFELDNNDLKDVNLTGGVSGNGRIITKEENSRNDEEIAFLEELESRLNWSKPILSQLHKIAPHYEKWVNTPVYRTCRLFGNPALEFLTYTPWYVVPIFWIPVIAYLIYMEYYKHVVCEESCAEDNKLTIFEYISLLAVGMLVWTAIEYVLHRWLFHFNPGKSLTWIKFHFLIHGMHHKTPFDILRLVFPPVPAVLIAATIFMSCQFLLKYPYVILAGGLTGYLIYDMIHLYVHYGSPRDGSYLYQMKRYHSNHHFLNHDKAFGISTMIWDYAFQTFVQVKKLSFSLYW